jgi:type VI secretion system secreted protein Hcp
MSIQFSRRWLPMATMKESFMKKFVFVLGLIAVFTTFGWAQKTNIVVAVEGLGCTTPSGPGTFPASAWSFGVSNTADVSSGGGGGAGKANVNDLSVTKAFDACSPSLFGGVVVGKHYKSVTLTQSGKKDSDLLVVTLTDVLVSSYQISGNQSQEDPFESLSFNFAKICIFESSSGSKFCYDRATATGI